MTPTKWFNMANIWVRGLKFSNPTTLKNVGFIQCGFPHVPNGHTGEDGNMVEKATSIFTRTPKPISGGLIQMFSSAPTNPGKNTGSGPHHDDKPGSKKGTGKPAKDIGSDPKNLHEEREAKDS
ncbi:hypothetical protein SUGI_1079330 [Cryptomeria japonica]|uniref:uncharacterized protein LOC131068130 n=1 Tax=Cryptomeria japonica TaxID=3369 RepID=UPI002414BDBF|nr:uncharacterized protein LOC131068130 [Cryptomeria japonica]GLJ50660.1 hypothetical protein SUGI_1079330 [Cryptomeria japonica]